MTAIFTIFIPIIFLVKFYLLGSFLSKKMTFNKDLFEEIIFGFSIYIILLNYFFFFVKQNIFFFAIFIIGISIIILLIKYFKKDSFLDLNKKFIIFFIINIIVSSLVIFYGSQFYVFRGNIYDFFSYLSTASIIAELSLKEISEVLSDKNFNDILLKEYANFIYARPSVQIFIAYVSKITSASMFINGFMVKSISLLLTFAASYSFFAKYFKEKNLRLICSLGFIFSSFFLYIYEIDALAHLLSIPLAIIIFKNLMELEFNNNKNLLFKCLLISFYSSCFFIIYPEGAVVILCPISIYVLYEIFMNKKIYTYQKYKLLFCTLILFFLITLPLYESTYKYLIFNQFSNSLNSTKDYWGYYGAFILGKANPIYDYQIVNEVKNLWKDNGSISELLFYIKNANIENGNKYFFLNIIPSIFGFYHLSTTNVENLIDYLLVIILIFLNLYLIIKVYLKLKNLLSISSPINNFYKIFLVYIVIISFYFLFSKNYWTVIKLYTYSNFFVYFFLIYDFKKNSFINKFLILSLIFFPIYKFSVFNDGIGRIDSFPSVMKKEFKLDNSWKLNYKKINSCKNIRYQFNDKLKQLYVKIAINDFKIKKIYGSFDCEIFYKNNSFKIK